MNVRDALKNAFSSFQAGQSEEAEVICHSVLKAHRDQPDALHLLGIVAMGRGDHARAVEMIERAVQHNARNPTYYTNLGEAYRALGEFERAISNLDRAVELDAGRPEAHCGLGNTQLAAGDIDAAIAHYDQALAINPGFAQAHYNKGNALVERGDLDAGIAAYRQAVASNPAFAQAHFNLGNLLQRTDDLVPAVASYEEAVRLTPLFADAWYNMGNALRKLGRLEAARQAYERAVELDMTLAGAHLHLGTIAKLQGRLDAALASFDRALDLEPEFALAISEQAHVHLIQGNPAKAIAGYQRAVDIDPSFAWGYMGLSGALAASDRQSEAREASRRAVQLRRTFAWSFLGRDPVGRVLVLKCVEGSHFRIDPDDRMASTGGMNNADYFFDRTRFRQASFFIDGFDYGKEAAAIPPCDVIFNAITDGDVVPNSLEIASAIAGDANVPIVNPPDIVARSQRHLNYQSMRDLDGIEFPPTIRIEERPVSKPDIVGLLDEGGVSLPVLIRRAGTHTGDSLEKVDDIEGLQAYFRKHLMGPYYIAEFRDFIDKRGAYVKMRAYIIGGVLYPSQYFVSDHWNVHVTPENYKLMEKNDWMLSSAKLFHSDPEACLGPDAYRALMSVKTALPMDYFGVDFTQLDDGRIFIFEANATMRIPYFKTGELDAAPYRKPSVEAMVTALSDLLEKRIVDARG